MTSEPAVGGHQVHTKTQIALRSLSHLGGLKPSQLSDFHDPAARAFFHDLTGEIRFAFFERAGVRAVITHLAVETTTARLQPDEPVTVIFRMAVGVVEGSAPERPERPRLGATTTMEVFHDDACIVRWDDHARWVRLEDGVPRPVETLPPEFEPAWVGTLPRAPRPPKLEGWGPVTTFTWGPRDTDLNEHVFFLSYLERVEDAFAERRSSHEPPQRCEMWFRSPAFLGERMQVLEAAHGQGRYACLQRTEDMVPCAYAHLT